MTDFGKDQNSEKNQRSFYRLGFSWKKNIKKNDHVYPVFIHCVKILCSYFMNIRKIKN